MGMIEELDLFGEEGIAVVKRSRVSNLSSPDDGRECFEEAGLNHVGERFCRYVAVDKAGRVRVGAWQHEIRESEAKARTTVRDRRRGRRSRLAFAEAMGRPVSHVRPFRWIVSAWNRAVLWFFVRVSCR